MPTSINLLIPFFTTHTSNILLQENQTHILHPISFVPTTHYKKIKLIVLTFIILTSPNKMKPIIKHITYTIPTSIPTSKQNHLITYVNLPSPSPPLITSSLSTCQSPLPMSLHTSTPPLSFFSHYPSPSHFHHHHHVLISMTVFYFTMPIFIPSPSPSSSPPPPSLSQSSRPPPTIKSNSSSIIPSPSSPPLTSIKSNSLFSPLSCLPPPTKSNPINKQITY